MTLLKLRPLEDRVYRHRCVEAWSMVIPWVGYSLSELIKQCQPLSTAKYVQFLSYCDRRVEHWGADETSIFWPYSEGLRMDEAMNPLTLLTFGLYGETLPNQDGAPVRIVVPWKYGFKSAKSIVTIKFVAKQPDTTWNEQAPNEYGFYSNVNPNVDHPRWSQKTERRVGLPFYAAAPHHAHVQRLRRPGSVFVHGDEFEEVLLSGVSESASQRVPPVPILGPGMARR